MVLVEGIDPATAYSLQARHSYKVSDIVFQGCFEPCVSRGKDGACVIDFNAFNTTFRDPRPGAFRAQSHS